MPINFPIATFIGQTYTFNTKTWIWNGNGWVATPQTGSQGDQGSQGNQGDQGLQGNNGNQGNQGDQGNQGPEIFNYLGTYNNGVTYSVGQAVTYDGSLYVMTTFIGAAGYIPPSYPSNWQLVLSKGDQGVFGSQGNQGYQGNQGFFGNQGYQDRKSTRLNSSHVSESRMPSSA